MSRFSTRSRLLVSLLLATPLLAACEKKAAPVTQKPASVGIDWAGDKSHVFELELTTTSRLGGAPSASPLVLRSGLLLSFRDAAGSKQALVQLREPHLVDAGGKPAKDAAEFDAELANPFAVELSGGVLTAYLEPPSRGAAVAGFRRHIVAVLQLAEHAPASTWTSQEWDATGLSKVEYRALAGQDHSWDWKKLAYERLVSTERRGIKSVDASKVMPQVDSSSGRLVTDATGIVSVTRDETLSVPFSDSAKLSTHTLLKLQRKGMELALSPAAWDQALKPLKRSEVGTPATTGDQQALTDQARIGSYTFPVVVQKLTALEGKDPDPALAAESGPIFNALVGIFRQQPETVDAAIKLVRSRSPISNSLLDALAAASTPNTLGNLAAVALDASLPDPLRLRAAGSFIRAREPGQSAIELAFKMVEQPLLRENALFGIGSFTRQLRERNQIALAELGTKALEQQLKGAKTASERATVLLAISNSASAALFDAAVSYQQDKDTSVRQAAIQAIRLMPQPEVEVRLREALSRKDQGDVLAALHSLGRRPQASRESVDRVEAIAKGDPSAEIRREAVQVLVLWSQIWPNLVPVLAEIREKDTDKRVREAAVPIAAAGTPPVLAPVAAP